MPETFKANSYPSRITIFPFGGNVTVGSALTSSAVTTVPGGVSTNPSAADGDTRTWGFYGASGTYTLTLYYQKNSSNGIFDYYIDDTIVLTGVDTYNAASTGNNTTTGTVKLGFDGYHKVKLVVNGKNGSSAGYTVQVGLGFMKPTTDTAITSGTKVYIPEFSLPRRDIRCHDEATITTGNALAFTADNNQFLNGIWMQSASANGDVFTQSIWVSQGSYYLVAVGQTDNTCAKIDWTLDGAAIASAQDWYSAALTRNVIKTSSAFSISASGYHILKGTINGRNASNTTAYNMKLGAYAVRQAGD